MLQPDRQVAVERQTRDLRGTDVELFSQELVDLYSDTPGVLGDIGRRHIGG